MRFSRRFASAALVLVCVPAILLGVGRMRRVHCQSLTREIIADGRFHPIARFTQRLATASELASRLATDQSEARVRLKTEADGSVRVLYRAPVTGGTMHPSFHADRQSWSLPIHTAVTWQDSIGDGLPDSLRLHDPEDRRRFRAWFATLADKAATLPDRELPSEISDCSALLRYCYRLALSRHDESWYKRFQPGTMLFLPSVQQWTYPDTPLGAGLFRVNAPSHTPDSNDFAEFADAKTLYSWNSFRIGRDVKLARPGDLLFFHQLEGNQQYHSMIVTGEDGEWVVYHTGPGGTGNARSRGEMRRARMTDLLQHPDPRWHPSPNNPNFLGVFRWNLLRED